MQRVAGQDWLASAAPPPRAGEAGGNHGQGETPPQGFCLPAAGSEGEGAAPGLVCACFAAVARDSESR